VPSWLELSPRPRLGALERLAAYVAVRKSTEELDHLEIRAAITVLRTAAFPYDRIERSPDLLRPIIAAKDVAEHEGDRRRQIAEAVFDSFAPQLDLSFAAAIYGLVGLFLGSLIGELLVASLLPRHRFAR